MFKLLDGMTLLLYCALIFWLSSQSFLPTPHLFPFEDKIHHFGAYFMMGILAWRNFSHYLKSPVLLAIVSLVFCSLYGVSDEWHQSFVPGRACDILDWVADSTGAGVAVLLLTRFFYKKNTITV
ncbi:MAG: VanZ family protein [Methyloglobulus sp.]|nr:VanZ family protein [Methyloglobulus sp.]